MPESFVNPLPGLTVEKFLFFDFPSVPLSGGGNAYEGEQFLGNIFLPDLPAIQEIYGQLGNPARNQGKPKIREIAPEAEDPQTFAGDRFHDQVLDIDRGIKINHTGRLSGTLVKFLFDHCTCNFYSEIKVTATDVTDNTAPSIILDTRCDQIVPQPQAKNVWFFKDPATKDELLFTLDTEVAKAADANLQAEHVYKLIINWRFWTACEPPRKRLPISGYDESISFEVITETENI